MAHEGKNQRKATLLGLAAVLAWSTVAAAFKLALRHLDHYQLLFLANGFSLLTLLGVLAWQRKLALLGCAGSRGYRRTLALGMVNPAIYYLILFKAYDLLPAQVAQPINFTWALTMSWLAVPLLGQKLRWRDGLAGVICYTGVLIISTGGDLAGFKVASTLGVALALVSTVFWSLYWIGNTRWSQGEGALDPVIALTLGFLFALPVTGAVTAFFSNFRFTASGLWAAAYVGVFEMGITFVLWLAAMRLTHSTAKIANLIFIAPFLSLVFIRFVLGEPLAAATFVGLVLIVGGLRVQGRGSG